MPKNRWIFATKSTRIIFLSNYLFVKGKKDCPIVYYCLLWKFMQDNGLSCMGIDDKIWVSENQSPIFIFRCFMYFRPVVNPATRQYQPGSFTLMLHRFHSSIKLKKQTPLLQQIELDFAWERCLYFGNVFILSIFCPIPANIENYLPQKLQSVV